MLTRISPREEEFKELVTLLEVMPVQVTRLVVDISGNELGFQHIKDLCSSLSNREFHSFGLRMSGCGLSKHTSLHLLDWLQYGLFVEDSLELDLSV